MFFGSGQTPGIPTLEIPMGQVRMDGFIDPPNVNRNKDIQSMRKSPPIFPARKVPLLYPAGRHDRTVAQYADQTGGHSHCLVWLF